MTPTSQFQEAEHSGPSAKAADPAIASEAPKFEVTEIELIDQPEGSDGQHWYRYRIDNGRSSISGQRCGSLAQVTEHVMQFAAQLNARNSRKPGSIWAPRRKKTG
jgi:hypothetical protein